MTACLLRTPHTRHSVSVGLLVVIGILVGRPQVTGSRYTCEHFANHSSGTHTNTALSSTAATRGASSSPAPPAQEGPPAVQLLLPFTPPCSPAARLPSSSHPQSPHSLHIPSTCPAHAGSLPPHVQHTPAHSRRMSSTRRLTPSM